MRTAPSPTTPRSKWDGKDYEHLATNAQFDMKRSAGIGVRIFLPMVGLMGLDWAYGFDKVYNNGSYSKGGSQFHFILGQEF